MKIIKYVKLKNNSYNVYIDDFSVKLYDDVIVKYELLRKKEIDKDSYEKIINDNNMLEAYYLSLKYLTKKMHCEKELFLYLKDKYDKKIIFDTINRLKKENYLNDDVYARCYINDQLLLSCLGPNKIIKNLIGLNCDEDKVKEYVSDINNEVWFDRIEKIIKKKLKSNRSYGVNKLKDKIIYDLENLGYYKWMIDEVLNEISFDDTDNILKKEYTKLYNKYMKKCDGKELEYKIISSLLNKGFEYDKIKKILNN